MYSRKDHWTAAGGRRGSKRGLSRGLPDRGLRAVRIQAIGSRVGTGRAEQGPCVPGVPGPKKAVLGELHCVLRSNFEITKNVVF